MILVLGKPKSRRAPNLGCRGTELPRWFDVSSKTSALQVMCEWVHYLMKLPITSCPELQPSESLQYFPQRNVKLNAKFCVDLLLYSLSYFEWNGHTVHMLTQWHLPPPLISTVKSSLFMHVHSSPLYLAAWLHRCHSNYSSYINNGWTFSEQTVCIYIYICAYICAYIWLLWLLWLLWLFLREDRLILEEFQWRTELLPYLHSTNNQ